MSGIHLGRTSTASESAYVREQFKVVHALLMRACVDHGLPANLADDLMESFGWGVSWGQMGGPEVVGEVKKIMAEAATRCASMIAARRPKA